MTKMDPIAAFIDNLVKENRTIDLLIVDQYEWPLLYGAAFGYLR